MNALGRRTILVAAALCSAAAAAHAQQGAPHIGYVYPAGGQRGATFEVTVGGQFIDGASKVYVSGEGVTATVKEYIKPITQGQFMSLREKFSEMRERRAAAKRGFYIEGKKTFAEKKGGKKGSKEGGQKEEEKPSQPASAPATLPVWTAADEKEFLDLLRKMVTFVRKPASPSIVERAILTVTIAPNAAPGDRELRLETKGGITNPMVFCVGQLPEVSKPPARTTGEQKQMYREFYRLLGVPEEKAETDTDVTLPAVLNGQIIPGGIDRYHFTAQKGDKLVVSVSARELIPYLADAVPGWFQAAVGLYDEKGKELAYDDHYQFRPDPVLYCVIPADGKYTLLIRDTIYRGREDFVYRVTVGQVPFVTSIFPLGGPAGQKTTVDVEGWNLPTSRMTMDARGKAPGIYPMFLCRGEQASNGVPFDVEALPECQEVEANNKPASAQKITLPVIVNGRIDSPGDVDVFRFEGHAGDEIVAEVYARRLGSPLDSSLLLADAAGKQVAFNDDCDDKGSGLNTHHADSCLSAKLPADGTYYLHLGDTQRKGGHQYGYRLRVGPRQPDFELRVVPSSINARGGASVPITVYALRKDGFENEIKLSLKDAPAGFSLGGAVVPIGQDQVRLTLAAPTKASKEPQTLTLQGSAIIHGKKVVHAAVPAEDMMQAFAYRHLVPADSWMVDVVRIGGRGMAKVYDSMVKLSVGGTAMIRTNLPASTPMGKIRFELNEPPEGITIAQVSPAQEGVGTDIVFRADAKVKPGLKGNLIVNIIIDRAPKEGEKKGKGPGRQRFVAGVLSAIPFEVVAAP